MINRMAFYLYYAARNLWRSRRWSAFAIFSVAAGVATIVALRSLGLTISDTLVDTSRSSNHGDILLEKGGGGFLSFGDPRDASVFRPQQVDKVKAWAAQNQARYTTYIESGNVQITALNYNSVGHPQFITTFFIDPASYPPLDDIRAVDPAGARLSELFQGGNEVVVSQNLADSQSIHVGDKVRVSGTTDEFMVRGIVPTVAESGLRNLTTAFFGFAYFDSKLAKGLPVPQSPNRISIALPDGTSNDDILQQTSTLLDLLSDGQGYIRSTSVPDLLNQNKQIGDVLGSFTVILGLGALLIGGVGIMNTMLVLVRHRTEEIATLKTFGLKGRQIALMFLAEAFILGTLGSLLGGLVGTVLSWLTHAYGERLIQQPLIWRLYPEAILFGLALGLVVTMVFGVAPVLTAVRVRPAIILRPNEPYIPRLGLLQAIGSILLVVVVIGLIAGQILAPTFAVVPNGIAKRASLLTSPVFVGIAGVAVVLLILALLVGLLWLIVWLVGKLPAFGSVDLQLALRNLSTRRVRTATTLMALSAGMFALSSVAFFGAGAREIVQFTLSERFGGNVLIFPVLPAVVAQPLIDAKIKQLGDQVEYHTRLSNYNSDLQAVDGKRVEDAQSYKDSQALLQQLNDAAKASDSGRVEQLSRRLGNQFQYTSMGIVVHDTTNPNFSAGTLEAGRQLTLDDRGKKVAVVRNNPLLTELGVHIGSTITLNLNRNGGPVDFQVVGLLPAADELDLQANIANFGDVIIPPDSLPGVSPQFQINTLQVAPEHMNAVLLDLSSLPLVYSLDITFIDGLLSRLIDQASAIPILVGLLSLLAAAVIMANTVALSTLERRRQIGILKAVGLKGQRVMRIMLLENTLISLLGGLIGLGLSALGVWVMTTFGLDVAQLVPRDALPVVFALVLAAVVIGWVATILSAQVAVRERVLNVLRYE